MYKLLSFHIHGQCQCGFEYCYVCEEPWSSSHFWSCEPTAYQAHDVDDLQVIKERGEDALREWIEQHEKVLMADNPDLLDKLKQATVDRENMILQIPDVPRMIEKTSRVQLVCRKTLRSMKNYFYKSLRVAGVATSACCAAGCMLCCCFPVICCVGCACRYRWDRGPWVWC